MIDYDIRQMYEDMEIRLIKSMKRNLQLHLDEEDETGFKYPQWQTMKLKELKRYQRQNKDIVGHDTKGFSSSISNYLKNELREGSYNALKDFREAMGDKYKANRSLSNSFFKINDKKVNSLINSVNSDLKTANRAVLRMTNDQYRKVIFQSQLYVANGVMTPKQAIDAANKDFLRRGLNVIEYKDGKRVNIASYSQMAIRTAGQRAMLMGEGAARKKLGVHLIRISAHGTSCELCIPWQGKVLIDDVYGGGSKKDGKYQLLSEAMDQGLFHPNCKHGISTYFGGKDDISDINASYANGKDGSESNAAYIDDMNYINRKINEYRRLEAGSLDETNVSFYKTKVREWTNKLKQTKDRDNIMTAIHSTSQTNAISILAKGFDKDKMNYGTFGKAVYASNKNDVINYYKQSLYHDGIVEVSFDTSDYASFHLAGLQQTERTMYKRLIMQRNKNIQEQYKNTLSDYMKQRRKFFNKINSGKDIDEAELLQKLGLTDEIVDTPNRAAFVKVMQDNGYKGMILEHDMSNIGERYYKNHKDMIEKVNDAYLDPISGGSQVVAWDLDTINIRRK